ncbi:MAG: adenylate/guanylate cyclase domain-containing protein, partial [Actinobacteria bacterium]|nr:adenylate/guanylate cyclase domain-containing protein [Actinomycetota bacterium]
MSSVTISVVHVDVVGPVDAVQDFSATYSALVRASIADGRGIEVPYAGDGVTAVYPSLGAALDSAVAVQQGIERHNREAPVPIGVRVGLSSGDATEDNGRYTGEPVEEAVRLCATAAAGQIVTTEMVRLLARRTEHSFAPLGERSVHGLPEAVEA